MKKIIFTFLLCNSVHATIRSDLKNLYELSSKQTEFLKISQSKVDQALNRTDRSRGINLPQLSGRYNYLRQDPPPGANSPFTRPNQFNTAINVTQVLYDGTSFGNYDYAKLDYSLQLRLLEQEGFSLWYQNVDVFFSYLISQNDLNIAIELRELSEQRVKEIQARVRLGKSRNVELSQALTQLALASSEVSGSKKIFLENQEKINFLAGSDFAPTSSLEVLKTSIKNPQKPLDTFLIEMNNRPDIKARSAEINLAEIGVELADAGHKPSLNAGANYYLNRSGVLRESDWDAGINLVIPLFRGGSVQAYKREALEKKRETILRSELNQRAAERDIRTLWLSLNNIMTMVGELEVAEATGRKSYLETQQDYRMNFATNLDLITSMNNYIFAKRKFQKALFETEMLSIQLQLAAGAVL